MQCEKVLPNLTAEDLKDLGVGMVGHRRMLLDAIAALRAETCAPTPLCDGPLAIPEGAKDTVGRVTEGLPALRQAMSRYRSTSLVMIPLFTTMLAEAEFGAGREQEGMDHLEACDRDAVSLNQLFWRAGILHLKGERLAARHEDTAEACLRASLELASGQQAKSLELRAATGLARLFQQQGRRDEARDLLAPIFGWFTEGFDTLDLKQAKALLDELA